MNTGESPHSMRGPSPEASPGPWHVEPETEHVIASNGATVVYELNTNEADARLIAAAPELLAALEAITEAFNATDPKCGCDTALGSREQAGLHHESCRIRKLVDARAAIAKAVGEVSTLCAVCDQIRELHPNTHPFTPKAVQP